ncbi:hypothetical protein [Bradyrhizobium sp. AS23.2]|uniref:hypothetical protein n=1 Tax=Bradyrhizobium sp. AS23.2 TaxID=1680155 RepID=UPI0011614E2D|nr:hypothetical protein [Bradyrhizobium sp. AS23.2]
MERLLALPKMNTHLFLVCGALAGITILHVTGRAVSAASNSTTAAPAANSAPHKTNGQSATTIEERCEDEWRANREAMMKRDMTQDHYVEQCSVKDDVPNIAVPSPTPNGSPDR